MNLLQDFYFSDINLRFQVGGTFSIGENADWSYHKSTFSQNKFYLITGGKCTIHFEDGSFEGKPGRWFFIPAGVPHAYENDKSEPFCKHWIHFDIDNDDSKLINMLNLPYFVDVNLDEVEAMFYKLEGIAETNEVAKCFFVKAALFELFAKYISVAGCGKYFVEKTKDELLNKALVYIEKNMNNEISVEQLAEICHLHPTHFIRIFKKRTGVTPARFIKGKRLEYAKKLIEETEIPLFEIGARIGCSNPASFSKMYKSFYGVSPKSYRAHLRDMEKSFREE